MPHILNQSQAEAIYSAMCTLNNVSGYLNAVMHGIRVTEHANGVIQIISKDRSEDYRNQAAFAAAYGLDGKEPRTAEYTPGIGWQTVTKTGRRGNFDTEAQALAA